MDIRLTTTEDAERLKSYFSENRDHFQQWEPARDPDYYSQEEITQKLADCEQQHVTGSAAHFIGLINGEVVSHCSLTNIIYGPLQGCFMGYGVSKKHEGTGVMTEVCLEAINYAFKNLGLNRIMANHMPRNTRSARLLKKLGFTEEGLAKKYLRINGKWEDHVLTSKLNPDWVEYG
ncbi:GNAT family N-acetyltransferase [Marinimicrobium agarilyticum]|uniref:GNAT family N-acetyltransferase n=1 Tax=Marinimicrobium agarilyticum TaxID=306546 RepID=UPI000482E665|nr:GNAT family N-acetyltransferase [Marinimicrobium agarilyticum]